MEVLAGFLLGYLLGTEAGGRGVSVMRDAFGSVVGSEEIHSVVSSGMSTAQGLVGGVFSGGGSARAAIGDMAASDEVRGLVSAGMTTAQGLAVDLFARGKELVAQQRSHGFPLVS